MPRISTKELLRLRSRGSRAGTKRKGKGRRRKRDETKKMAKDAAFGGLGGLAASIGLTVAGRYLNQPVMAEVGQRAGAVIAGHLGGDIGQITYQVGDAVADRYLRNNGMVLSGTVGYGV